MFEIDQNLAMRILLAEDDSVLADGLTRSLRQAGYATDCVARGLVDHLRSPE